MIKAIDLIIGEKMSGAMTIRWHKKRDKFWIPKYYGEFNALSSGKPLTPATIARLHRAQLRLAGLQVAGWPWPDFCKCYLFGRSTVTADDGITEFCVACGKELDRGDEKP